MLRSSVRSASEIITKDTTVVVGTVLVLPFFPTGERQLGVWLHGRYGRAAAVLGDCVEHHFLWPPAPDAHQGIRGNQLYPGERVRVACARACDSEHSIDERFQLFFFLLMCPNEPALSPSTFMCLCTSPLLLLLSAPLLVSRLRPARVLATLPTPTWCTATPTR